MDYSGLLDQQEQVQLTPQQKQQSPVQQVSQPSENKQEQNQPSSSQEQTAISPQKQQQTSNITANLIHPVGRPRMDERTILFPPQWIQCDLRYLDMSILGRFI